MTVRLLPLGDTAWTVEFGNEISPELNAQVQGYATQLQEAQAQGHFPEIIEVLPTFRSVTVYINPLAGDPLTLKNRLIDMAEHIRAQLVHGRRWQIPVCFGGEFGEDLEDVAKHAGLTSEQVIEQMLGASFRVYLLGFMPGFPFMGGLPPALSIPRLSTPRQKVPARTVAIAGVMGAIYPWESPGGWRLLGRTPIPLFDIENSQSPTLLSPGDEVTWRRVGLDEFTQIEERFAQKSGSWAEFEVKS